MDCRERLEQMLAQEGVKYETVVHPSAYTAQEVAAVEHVSGYQIAKVVMAVVETKPVMLVLPAPYRVDVLKVKAALQANAVRLAKEDEFFDIFPDCEVGAMPPFGNLYGIPVYVDQSLSRDPEIIFNAGSHRETMKIPYADFVRLVRPRVAEIATSPRAPVVGRRE